jgi:hypothetical protein
MLLFMIHHLKQEKQQQQHEHERASLKKWNRRSGRPQACERRAVSENPHPVDGAAESRIAGYNYRRAQGTTEPFEGRASGR